MATAPLKTGRRRFASGYWRRNDCQIQLRGMTTRIAIAVVEHQGRYLVGRRPEGVRFAGYAEFPGGKVEADETPEAAAVRECREETGLAVEVAATLQVVEDGPANLQLHFLDCRAVEEQPSPVEPFRWVTRDELAECQFPPANAGVVEQLLAQAPPTDNW